MERDLSEERKSTVLVVEDELKAAEALKAYLEKEGYEVFHALMGTVALNVLASEKIDLVILDLMLPDISGEEVCREIRNSNDVPIIMLTAKSSEDSRVNGLNIGADDYLVKPFSPRELVARVKAIMRRSGAEKDKERTAFEGGLVIDYLAPAVYKNGKETALTPNEFKILSFLSKNPGRYHSRDALIENVLGQGFDGYDRAIDSHVKNIRQKIEDNPKEPRYIITQYGFGYKFAAAKL